MAHCGVNLEDLHVYSTTEPLAYYSRSRRVPQNILILENKDTFYSMRRFLLGGAERILGEEISTVIYGGGKGILRSFADFSFCVEPHINDAGNRILYFGDLDYEGIGIYERLENIFKEEWGAGAAESQADIGMGINVRGAVEGKAGSRAEMMPFVAAYEKMLEKAGGRGMDFLPETAEKQNRNISGQFFRHFSQKTKARMEYILQAGKYIPQEIITITDLGIV